MHLDSGGHLNNLHRLSDHVLFEDKRGMHLHSGAVVAIYTELYRLSDEFRSEGKHQNYKNNGVVMAI